MKLRQYSTRGFDRGASAAKEALWLLCKAVCFLAPFPVPSSIRCALLRAFGGRIGRRVVIRSGVNISFPWRLEVHDDVWLGEHVTILSLAKVTIESDCCLSQQAFLCTGSHDFQKETFDLITRPVTIRAGSWIAARAFVAPDVEVGPNSVLSAGSIALESIPPNSLAQGNPARPVRQFEERQ